MNLNEATIGNNVELKEFRIGNILNWENYKQDSTLKPLQGAIITRIYCYYTVGQLEHPQSQHPITPVPSTPSTPLRPREQKDTCFKKKTSGGLEGRRMHLHLIKSFKRLCTNELPISKKVA